LSQIVCAKIIAGSQAGRGIAIIGVYAGRVVGKDMKWRSLAMLHCHSGHATATRSATAPRRCPQCSDWMVAPIRSEFLESGEIRHRWECESCGESSVTSIAFPAS